VTVPRALEKCRIPEQIREYCFIYKNKMFENN